MGLVLRLLLLLLLALCGPQCHAVRYIFLPLMGGNSPSMDLLGVAAALQARGHEVTVVVTETGLAFAKQAAARHSSNTTAEAMRYVVFHMSHDPVAAGLGTILKQVRHPGRLSSLKLLTGIQTMLASPCAALLQDKAAVQALQALHADAIMGIALPMPHSDSCGCVMSHLLGAPFIDINGHPLIDAPVTVPQFGSGLPAAELRTIKGFARNLLAYNMRTLMPRLVMDFGHNPWTDIRSQAGLPRAASSCLLTNGLARVQGHRVRRCSALLEVMLSSFLLEHPRPLAAHQRLVGPGSPRAPHPIQPPDVAAFADGASQQGLVLVAFGSTIQTVMMTKDDIMQLAQGFAALDPIRVLWAMSAKGLPEGLCVSYVPVGANTRIVSWVDYNDVLGHPNVRVFVSHCGVHSVNEAAFHGVPVVAVPIQFEQAEHAARLAARGVGVISYEAPAYRRAEGDPLHYTAEGITSLIREVMGNASYSQAARRTAVALQRYAAHRHPYQRAADEVELVTLAAAAAGAGAATTAPGAVAAEASTSKRPHEEL